MTLQHKIMLGLVALFVLQLLVCSLWVLLSYQPHRRTRQAKKRGGFTRTSPGASGYANPITVLTKTRLATSMESNGPQDIRAAFTHGPEWSAANNRIGSPTGSTSATTSNPGAPMTAVERALFPYTATTEEIYAEAKRMLGHGGGSRLQAPDSHVAPYTWPTT